MRRVNLRAEDYYSQLNNVIEPGVACMPTARVMFYIANGVEFEAPRDRQPEDYFTELLDSDAAKAFRDEKYPSLRGFPPREIHGMYGSWLDEKVCGRRVSDFRTDLGWEDFLGAALRGESIMTSGTFGEIAGHAFVVVGADEERGVLLIADPFGDYHTGYESSDGYLVEMGLEDFTRIVKPSPDLKWGHVLLGRV